MLGALAGTVGLLPSVFAQVSTVYVDDSVAATESFQRIPDLQASGNMVEVLRVAQRLLDEEGDRLIASATDVDLFVSVRARVHELLVGDPALLARYRQLEGPRAEVMVSEGQLAAVERTRLLTAGGFEGAIRLARRDLEAARFDAAAIRLAQIQLHPDLTGENASRAADLAAEIAKFSPAATDLAVSLARAAGRAVPTVVPVVEPARARIRSLQAGADQGPLDLRSVASEPLASAEIASFAHSGKAASDRGASPWVIPCVVGDSLYTNDGVEVAAWDRWTLVPRWKFSTITDDPDSVGFPDQGGLNALEQASRSLEDSSTVTVGSGVVIATTGFAVNNARRNGDARIHAFDPVLGTPLWSVDLSRLDRQLAEASVRGPVLIVGDTAVVAADRFSMGRRLASSLLVGLDCSTGAVRWVRTLANIGLPPIGQLSRPADQPIEVGGVVYLTDSIGVTAAVEASTGRFVWVHRLQGTGFDEPFRFSRRGESLAWLGSSIVADGGTLLTVEPGTGDLVRLASSDGRLVGRRILDRNDQPRSLMRVGDYLAAINASGINVYPIQNISESPMQNVTLRRGALLSGRPVVSGRTLLIPTAEGIMVVNPESPTAPVSLPLAASGHPVLADGQLFMASASAVRSFQAWEAVEPKLTAAIAANPKDAAPGLAYVRIALRAGKAAGVPDAADRLLAVLDIDPGDPASQAARRSLFELLRSTVVASRDLVLDAGAPKDPAGSAVVPLGQIDPLLARLARAADTPSERAEHLLLASWASDAQSRHGLAIESLQAILQQPDLAAAVVPSASRSGPALVPGWEAARERLGALLARVGYEPYGPFAAQADRERADLGEGPEAGEAFARRFPASRAAVAVLTQVADKRLALGQAREAMADLGAAIDAARTIAAATRQPMLPDSAAAAGRLLTLLAKHGREGEAWRLLGTLDAQAPGVPLSDAGGTIDRVAFGDTLRKALSSQVRRSDIGSKVSGPPQLLAGWTMVRPRHDTQIGRATDQIPMASSSTRQVGLWARRPEDGRLAPLWTRATDPRSLPPSFLRVDWDVSYLYLHGERGPVVECVATDGSSRWRTEPLDTLLPPEAQDGVRARTPQDEDVGLSSLLWVVHDRTLVLVRRSGAAAAFDLNTGKSVWARKLDLTLVSDVAAAAGRLVLLGEFGGPQQPRIVMTDLATGRAELVLGDEQSRLASSPRWIRPAGDRMILGLEDSIWGLDPSSGAALWKIVGSSAAKTQECWIVGDRAMVLGGDGRPWMFEWSAETPTPIPFESQAGLNDLRRRKGPDDQVLHVGSGPQSTIVAATDQGISIFDRSGALVGVDALPVGDGPFLSAVGEKLAVYLQAEAEPDRDGKRELTMWFVELPSARLVGEQHIALYDTPSRIAVLDAKVVVTVGNATSPVSVIFDVPVAETK
jgi:outer membrane protein assembly factor BamB